MLDEDLQRFDIRGHGRSHERRVVESITIRHGSGMELARERLVGIRAAFQQKIDQVKRREL
ncbi:MAG TPA: hypothetical protein VFV70_14910, partial [Hyphomonadaceae bacterium]|nr:hypothetical protein [Hyphomonadaceae bacterium]